MSHNFPVTESGSNPALTFPTTPGRDGTVDGVNRQAQTASPVDLFDLHPFPLRTGANFELKSITLTCVSNTGVTAANEAEVGFGVTNNGSGVIATANLIPYRPCTGLIAAGSSVSFPCFGLVPTISENQTLWLIRKVAPTAGTAQLVHVHVEADAHASSVASASFSAGDLDGTTDTMFPIGLDASGRVVRAASGYDTGGSPVSGTGLNHTIALWTGTATLSHLGVATNGQIPIGSTGADPVLATITAGTGITVTNAAGAITITNTGPISGLTSPRIPYASSATALADNANGMRWDTTNLGVVMGNTTDVASQPGGPVAQSYRMLIVNDYNVAGTKTDLMLGLTAIAGQNSIVLARANGTNSSKTALSNGDVIWSFHGAGWQTAGAANTYELGPTIEAVATGPAAAGAQPGGIRVLTNFYLPDVPSIGVGKYLKCTDATTGATAWDSPAGTVAAISASSTDATKSTYTGTAAVPLTWNMNGAGGKPVTLTDIGNISIGSATDTGLLGLPGGISVTKTGSIAAAVLNAFGAPGVFFVVSANGTPSVPTKTLNNDVMGGFGLDGFDGAATYSAGGFNVTATSNGDAATPTATMNLNAAGEIDLDPTGGVVKVLTGSLQVGVLAAAAKTTNVLKGSASLNFGNTAAGTSSDLTITVTGAADGDVVSLGVPIASQVANGTYSAFVSAANTVTVRFSNSNLVTALDPGAGTFKVLVTQIL